MDELLNELEGLAQKWEAEADRVQGQWYSPEPTLRECADDLSQAVKQARSRDERRAMIARDRGYQHLRTVSPDRVETGVVRFGSDWPGVFIRGDSAMAILASIQRVKDSASGVPVHELRELEELLHGCHIDECEPGRSEQRIYQLHQENTDTDATEMVSQAAFGVGEEDSFEIWRRDVIRRHPLPEGCQWVLHNQDSPRFVWAAQPADGDRPL